LEESTSTWTQKSPTTPSSKSTTQSRHGTAVGLTKDARDEEGRYVEEDSAEEQTAAAGDAEDRTPGAWALLHLLYHHTNRDKRIHRHPT
jgi:hypothetical protein